MVTHWWQQRWFSVAEDVAAHIAFVVIGFIMAILGLGLGVTMVMLPAGVVIGLIGVAMMVGGLFAHVNRHA